jgi:hypothetical protein
VVEARELSEAEGVELEGAGEERGGGMEREASLELGASTEELGVEGFDGELAWGKGEGGAEVLEWDGFSGEIDGGAGGGLEEESKAGRGGAGGFGGLGGLNGSLEVEERGAGFGELKGCEGRGILGEEEPE